MTRFRLLFSGGRQQLHSNTDQPLNINPPLTTHNGIRVESVRSYVCGNHLPDPDCARCASLGALTDGCLNSYNKYLSVAAQAVRRSLKEDKRIVAERRGLMELRFAKWSVSVPVFRGWE